MLEVFWFRLSIFSISTFLLSFAFSFSALIAFFLPIFVILSKQRI